MAVDTAARRRAFQSAAWAPQLPFPDGEFVSADRFVVQGLTAFYAALVTLASGEVSVAFSSGQPSVAFAASYPGVAFAASQPAITFTN